jgi:hypothetical protein
MPIYHLAPLDMDDPCWRNSANIEKCDVHAPDEATAREWVAEFFSKVDRNLPYWNVALDPWKQECLVTCKVRMKHPYPYYLEGTIVQWARDNGGHLGTLIDSLDRV